MGGWLALCILVSRHLFEGVYVKWKEHLLATNQLNPSDSTMLLMLSSPSPLSAKSLSTPQSIHTL